MQKKKLIIIFFIALLLQSLKLNINVAFAWYNKPVQTKTLYDAAKMGTTTQYPYAGPAVDRHPQFYSALIADGASGTMFGFVYPELVKIEVSGTDPLGGALTGDSFTALSVLSSPDDSGVTQEILQLIFDYLYFKSPPGLKAIVKNTMTSGGATFGWAGQKAWGTWQRPTWATPSEERGLRFGYQLAVDPALDGTYTINIHYHAWICSYNGMTIHHVGYIDLYDTVYYEYVNTPLTPSAPSGGSSGYRWTSYPYTASTTDPNGDYLKYKFDWGDGTSTLTEDWIPSGVPATESHRWNNIGAYIVRVRAKDTTGAWSEWSPHKRVNIIKKPGFPCPTLFVWDGSEYVEVGVLGIHDDSDITFLQGIDQTFVPEKHLYKLSLRELDEFTSHIDNVKLYAIDNEVEKYECYLAQAVHSELGHVEGLLLHDDDKRVDLNPLQTIDLKFTAPNINEIAYFIFEINGYNIKP